MALRKDPLVVKRNYVAFYTTDSVKNWIDESSGFEKRSTFIHRTLDEVRKKEQQD